MISGDTAWKVLPHDPIERLADNLWRVEGALPRFGMRRVMSVVRLSTGKLLIHSAIALEESAMRELEAWGEPAILLVPHARHRMDAPRYVARYPALRVLAPKGVVAKAREVVRVDGTYEDFEGDPAVELRTLSGTKRSEGVLVVQSSDGVSVIVTELVFDLRERPSKLQNFALRALRLGPGPRVTPIVKLELIDDRGAVRDELRALAALPDLVRLVVGHERLSRGPAAAEALRRAADSLG